MRQVKVVEEGLKKRVVATQVQPTNLGMGQEELNVYNPLTGKTESYVCFALDPLTSLTLYRAFCSKKFEDQTIPKSGAFFVPWRRS